MGQPVKDYFGMADMPAYIPGGGFPDKAAVEKSSVANNTEDLEQMEDTGIQVGAHPGKSQPKRMKFFE